ncbi:MAG: efflux RND transporter periplasmic adaptor subunit [Myxococcales bacterium]|nr:efflux RND transporter periplasmic adaptor subunit [Myxococcales bacterium]
MALLLVLVVGIGLGRLGVGAHVDDEAATAGDVAIVWTCSMHPQIRMSEPGQCPICGMDLIPDEDAAASPASPASPAEVSLSPAAQALARLRTTPVVRTEPRAQVRLLGRVDYDETRLRMVTPWTKGRIDRLKVRVTGSRVRKGQVVALLYSPEVYAAMRDLVVAVKQADRLAAGMHGAEGLASAAVGAARERLRLLGVSEGEIDELERSRAAPKQVSIRSSFSGTVLERNVEEGDYVEAGTALYHIADLSRVWVQIDAYESDLPHLAVGQPVLVQIDSLPDESFTGEVAFIDPIIDPQTRTTRVRVEVANEERRILPGMFAQAVVDADVGDRGSHLVIPVTAPLFTGRRSVVYVEDPAQPGTYALREVRLGPRAGPVYPVLAGLSEGERVVSQGAFVLDADLQLDGGRSMMTRGDDREGDPAPLPITPPVLAELEPVVSAYVDAQQALAGDALDDARARLDVLAALANGVELPGPRAVREAWRPLASALAGHGRHAARAQGPGEVRAAFEHVSAQVLAVLRAFGNPTDDPLRVAYCPMAFDDRGAQWVQRGEALANPYYGASMLRCGDFEATVLPGERLAGALRPQPATPPDPGGSAPAPGGAP